VLATGPVDPLLKWPGGKSGELSLILPALPSRVSRYFEPFLGGGAVYWAITPDIPAFVNDKSSDLIGFYRCVASANRTFFSILNELGQNWQKLEMLVDQNREQLVTLYARYSANRISHVGMLEKVNDFVIENAQLLRVMFSRVLTHNNGNFLVEVEKNLVSKLSRMRHIEDGKGKLCEPDVIANIEGSLKSAFYMHLRHIYNHSRAYKLTPERHSAVFFFIREHAYASMFRFNARGEFNVPYGGLSYNRKDMGSKIAVMRTPVVRHKLSTAVLANLDFMDFLAQYPPDMGDFMFVDPPYDSDFSNYDQNSFTRSDQERLADYLINHCKANYMLVIKSTPYILALYNGHGLNIGSFGKKYMWTIKERNNRDVTHLVITNYERQHG